MFPAGSLCGQIERPRWGVLMSRSLAFTVITLTTFLTAGCATQPAPKTVRVGEEFAAAQASARELGYEINDVSQLAMTPTPGGFYVELTGDRALLVFRGKGDKVASLQICESWSRSKVERGYRAVESFELPPASSR